MINKKKEEAEIISQRIVESSDPTKIKLKIKERVSQKKKKQLSLLTKLFFVLSACLLGMYLGTKIVERYLRFWRSPVINLPSEEKSGVLEIKPGEVFSIGQ